MIPSIFSTLENAASLFDAFLRIRLALFDSTVAKALEVDALEGSLDDEFCDAAAGSGSVHHAVAGKPANDVKIVEPALPVADDRVAVEFALLVQAGPGTMAYRRLEHRKSVCQGGPDDALEVLVINFEIEAAWLVSVDQTTGVGARTKLTIVREFS